MVDYLSSPNLFLDLEERRFLNVEVSSFILSSPLTSLLGTAAIGQSLKREEREAFDAFLSEEDQSRETHALHFC
ncbi:MAG: hypothetical protein K0S07_142 [Chlamydiales bacterium]|nr:hypothetical protein [Chlamydiales bacterium]